MKVITLRNFHTLASVDYVTDELRATFADVFAHTYTQRLAPVLKHAIDNNIYKDAAELRLCPDPILQGFSDLLVKQHFFSQPLAFYRRANEIYKVFHLIYHGAGFDDEAASIQAFYDLDLTVSHNAREHFERIKPRLSAIYQAEIIAYLDCLDVDNRVLTAVNFLALMDQDNKMQGFAIFHLILHAGVPLLHVRQAAMRHVGRGMGSLMAAYFTEHYPHAIYEANQRKANHVVMKSILLNDNLLLAHPAVVGYPEAYYQSWRGKESMLALFLKYQAYNHPDKALFARFGKYYEAESIQSFFRPTRMHKDDFILHDDNYCQQKLTYLSRSRNP